MTSQVPSTTEADRRFREWMRLNLNRAASHFGLVVAREPVFGWRLRSIGAEAAGPEGRCWLRVVSERPQWAGGHAWTGNADANLLSGIPKPRLLGVHEWAEGDWRTQRAEVLTLLPGKRCASADTGPPDHALPDEWWRDLRAALARLAATPTQRVHADQEKVTGRVREAFGSGVAVTIEQWETVHGDLHWANLLDPLGILDWELWGRGPRGTDAATLYCYSLASPNLARQVRDSFPVLGTPDGRRAQFCVAARLLRRAKLGDHPQLVEPLRRHVRELLSHPEVHP